MGYDVIVVGGGPAGMLGAAAAAAKGARVLLLEKNDRPGRKLLLTGNGRCNVTNNGGMEDHLDHVVTNKKFLYSAYKNFDSRQLRELLASLGVKTRVEPGGRVFPVSNKAADIVNALYRHLRSKNVETRFGSEAKRILVRHGRVSGVLLSDGTVLQGKNVILATGGMSYRQTGSTGDGYRMARQLGHSVSDPQPALVPLVTGEKWVKDLQGLAPGDVALRAMQGDKIIVEQHGEIIFTHFGLSGPAVLKASSFINTRPGQPVRLVIDLQPALPAEQLGARLRDVLAAGSGRYLKNALAELLPHKLVPVILALAGVEPQKQVDQVSKKERGLLVHALKNLTLTVTGTRPLNEAIVTRGGINVKEINPSTMESKIIAGLYFAGEVMDVDALTGGYNLQIAFSTGYLAGTSAAAAIN